DLVLQRKACLDRFRKARIEEDRKQSEWLPELIEQLKADHPTAKVSRTALFAWDKAVRTPADLIEMADGRGGDQYHDRFTDFWKRFQLDFLCPNQPKIRQSYERVRTEMKSEGFKPNNIPSYKTVTRQLDDRIAPATQAFHRDPEGEYKSKFLPNIKQDTERFAAGRCWVFDHTRMDCFIRAGERVFRPWLTTAQDWRTRKIVGWCLTVTPHSDSILLTLREGMLDADNMGGPEDVCFDNGKDFDSWFFDGRTKRQRQRKVKNDWIGESSFRGIFAGLNIEPHFSMAYAPNGKARMERWYGYLHDNLERSVPTYCGKDTTSKPAGLEKRLADLKQVPTYEVIHERLSDWVDGYNRRADHNIEDLVDDGIRVSPMESMAAWCDTRRMFGETEEHGRQVLDLLLMHHDRPVSVQKTGVRVTVAGQKLYYGLEHGVIMPELRGYQGRTKKKVRCAYDPHDLSTVHVYDDADGRLLCIAPNNLGEGGGRQRVSEAHRAIREHHKHLKAAGLGGVLPKLSVLEYQLAGGELPEAPEPTTKSIKPVQTGFEQAAKDKQRHEMRNAAGAEHKPTETPKPVEKAGITDIVAMMKRDPFEQVEEDDDSFEPLASIGPAPGIGSAPIEEPPSSELVEEEEHDDPLAIFRSLRDE
ncbi:MAG: Mu transposase C-terminal domain-containing protein, partial [Planctomycetota bacterium]